MVQISRRKFNVRELPALTKRDRFTQRRILRAKFASEVGW